MRPPLTMSRRDCVIFTCVAAFLLVSVSFHFMLSDNVQWTILDKHRTINKPSDSSPEYHQKDPMPAYNEEGREPVPQLPPVLPECQHFPKDTSDIMLVMKTGATAAFNRLPVHLMTTLRCVDDFLLFSDMEQKIGTHTIHNALDEVSVETKKGNQDFDLYRKLQEYQKLGGNPLKLSSDNNGWNLDKYKFIHMIVKTHRMRPDSPWYFFVEADTFFNWENLVTFLKKLNPKKPYYIGSNAYIGDVEFAHGGTGFILSNAAVRKFIAAFDDVAGQYDPRMKMTCCGDAMLAEALRDSGILLTKAWPMTNGEKPISLPFKGPDHWCQPIITMHHVNQIEVSDIWAYEQERRASNGTKVPLILPPLKVRSYAYHYCATRPQSSSVISSTSSSLPTSLPPATYGTTSPTTLSTVRLNQKPTTAPMKTKKLSTANIGMSWQTFKRIASTLSMPVKNAVKRMISVYNSSTRRMNVHYIVR